MSEWKEYKLGEIVEIITGYPFPGDKYESTGNLRVVRGENVTIGNLRWDTEKHWNHETEGLEKYFLQSGDIVIGMDGSRVGDNRAKVKQVDLPLILAQRVACLRAKKKFSQDYLWYTIFSDNFKKYVEAIHTGTSIPHISQKQIEDFEILCPPLEPQRRIAAILSSLDDKIGLLHRENATLEQMAETLFRQWFVVEAKEEWEEGKLGDLIVVKYGKDHKKLLDGKIPVIGSGGIMRYADTALYDKESVLIPRKGTLNNVMYINEPFWTVDTMFYTEMRRPNIAKFVFHFMKGQDLANMNVGSAVPSMTTEVLNNIQIDIPSQDVFNKFENSVGPLYNKKEQNNKQIRTLIQTRDGLLTRLMSGEVKI